MQFEVKEQCPTKRLQDIVEPVSLWQTIAIHTHIGTATLVLKRFPITLRWHIPIVQILGELFKVVDVDETPVV
jgi:hypothetical protein